MAAESKKPANSALMRQVGLRLRWLREEFDGMTQARAAELCGTEENAWNRYENGSRVLDPFVAVQIANRFRVTSDYIWRGILSAQMDPELALRLAARHPELVLGQTDMPPSTDTAPASRKATKKLILAE